MSEPSPIVAFLGRVAYETSRMRPLLPTYLHLLVSAVFPVFTGAHASLSRPSSAAAPEKGKGTKTNGEGDEDVVAAKMEGLSPSDAIIFPILAATTLSSLYFLLKWLKDPAILNQILGYYFSQIGLVFGVKFLRDVFSTLRSFVMPYQYSENGGLWKADDRKHCYEAKSTTSAQTGVHQISPLPGFLRSIPLPLSISSWIWKLRHAVYAKGKMKFHLHRLVTVQSPVDLLDCASILIATSVVVYHTFISKPWYLTNFLGFSFCYGSLQYMSPTTSWTGTLLLSALFIYDIYFVFFTPMMVTVATNLDVPIKLLFPRPDRCVMPTGATEGSTLMEEYLHCISEKRTMAMPGLGDIVIPGMMIAFALRFDLYLFYQRQMKRTPFPITENKPKGGGEKPRYISATGGWGERFWTSFALQPLELKAKRFPKPYFYASMTGYLLGMVTTLVIMQVAEHAQPALLYLVPGVLISLWGTALVKGELSLLWIFSEAGEEDEEKEKTNTDNEELGSQDETHGRGNDSAEIAGEKMKAQNDKLANPAKTEKKKSSGTDSSYRDLISFSITLPRKAPVTAEPPTKATANATSKITPTTPNSSTERTSHKLSSDLADTVDSDIAHDNVRSSPHTFRKMPLDTEANMAVPAGMERSMTGNSNEMDPAEKRGRKS